MDIGNWRSAILVKCKTCKKYMSHYKVTDNAQCVTCQMRRLKK